MNDELRNSDGNRLLYQLLTELVLPATLLEQYLDVHGDGCECAFCSANSCADYILDDLRGLRWVLTNVSAAIASSLLGTPDNAEKLPTPEPVEGKPVTLLKDGRLKNAI
jgi:hypothetical protein